MINRTAKSPSQYHNQSQHTVHIQSYVYSTYTITSYIYIYTYTFTSDYNQICDPNGMPSKETHDKNITQSVWPHSANTEQKILRANTSSLYGENQQNSFFNVFFLFIQHISSFSHPLSHSLIPNTDFLHINFPHKYSFKEIWSHLLK